MLDHVYKGNGKQMVQWLQGDMIILANEKSTLLCLC